MQIGARRYSEWESLWKLDAFLAVKIQRKILRKFYELNDLECDDSLTNFVQYAMRTKKKLKKINVQRQGNKLF